jgi:hypothetical protein
MYNTPRHTGIHNRLPEDEPLGSKQAEDINYNITLENVHFVGLYCVVILQNN